MLVTQRVDLGPPQEYPQLQPRKPLKKAQVHRATERRQIGGPAGAVTTPQEKHPQTMSLCLEAEAARQRKCRGELQPIPFP